MTMMLTPQIPEEQKPKRMLEISKLPDGRDLVCINFSSLSIINTCMRKAQYALLQGLRSNQEAEALTFGKAIHKALEHWYCLPEQHRELTPMELEMADTLIGRPLEEESKPYPTALDSINEFVKAAQPLQWMGSEDKRSLNNGIKILKAYFKHYLYDGLEVLRDEKGVPYTEREVEFTMHEDSEKKIVFFGTIDVVLRSKINGQILVADHKTTAALGSAFYNRVNPNHQYTGYVWAAQECLGLDTDAFLVNGIQVAKTKSEFARQTTQRTPDDFEELKISVIDAVQRILKAKENNLFPMNTPDACNDYGSCTYYDICSTPKKLRENVIKAKYEVK